MVVGNLIELCVSAWNWVIPRFFTSWTVGNSPSSRSPDRPGAQVGLAFKTQWPCSWAAEVRSDRSLVARLVQWLRPTKQAA